MNVDEVRMLVLALVLVGAELVTVHAVVLSGAKAYAQIQFSFNSEARQLMYLCVGPNEIRIQTCFVPR